MVRSSANASEEGLISRSELPLHPGENSLMQSFVQNALNGYMEAKPQSNMAEFVDAFWMGDCDMVALSISHRSPNVKIAFGSQAISQNIFSLNQMNHAWNLVVAKNALTSSDSTGEALPELEEYFDQTMYDLTFKKIDFNKLSNESLEVDRGSKTLFDLMYNAEKVKPESWLEASQALEKEFAGVKIFSTYRNISRGQWSSLLYSNLLSVKNREWGSIETPGERKTWRGADLRKRTIRKGWEIKRSDYLSLLYSAEEIAQGKRNGSPRCQLTVRTPLTEDKRFLPEDSGVHCGFSVYKGGGAYGPEELPRTLSAKEILAKLSPEEYTPAVYIEADFVARD